MKGTAMNIREKIKNRIKNRKGMSLGEVLLSVLIMLLATGVVTTTVTLAVNRYLDSLSRSEANTLASTLECLMTNELAYTTEIHVDGTKAVTKFQSQYNAATTSISMFATDLADYSGKMMITYPEDAEAKPARLLADASYPNKLKVSLDKFTYDNATHTFTVTFTITRNERDIIERTFQVINVNDTKAATP